MIPKAKTDGFEINYDETLRALATENTAEDLRTLCQILGITRFSTLPHKPALIRHILSSVSSGDFTVDKARVEENARKPGQLFWICKTFGIQSSSSMLDKELLDLVVGTFKRKITVIGGPSNPIPEGEQEEYFF